MNSPKRFGVVVVGDEMLSGKRADKHFSHVIEALCRRGMQVAWLKIVGDDCERLVHEFMLTQQDEIPIFCFGGIGATPDDQTRQAAAKAFGTRLVRHPDAVTMIEAEFGNEAYPNRIRMVDLPEDSMLIPNTSNQIPGFTLYDHHFFPGSPVMAWPMLEWVLEQYYLHDMQWQVEQSLKVLHTRESVLIPLMETLAKRHPQSNLFNLPYLGEIDYVEVGFRGEPDAVNDAFSDLIISLKKGAFHFELLVGDANPSSLNEVAL